MPQMPEEIKRRLAEVTARFIAVHNVPYNDVTEFIQDISTILFDYMDIPLEED